LPAHLPAGARLLAAVSGGGDSIALLHALRATPYRIFVGHVDHGLRAGSARDARFVSKCAAQWELPCHVMKAAVLKRRLKTGESIEEAARVERYKKLEQLAKRLRCEAIITAHTADDQAETVLMNFLRGAGPSGLSGIPPVRSISEGSAILLMRPMLGHSRPDVRAYLREHRLTYREDPTNRSHRFFRNRIRHKTLPQLERESPGLVRRLQSMAVLFREEERFWEGLVAAELRRTARQKGGFTVVDLTRLFGYHRALSRRILRKLFPQFSFLELSRFETWARLDRDVGTAHFFGRTMRRKGHKLYIQTGH
jgi:tRNA(Ile)-lysidine synthase